MGDQNLPKHRYKGLDRLPQGSARGPVTKGCLVLEGGGWKGLYTLGVLDALMIHGINFSSVVGVSAGALSAVGYLSGQIGWGAGIDLRYRHDSNYCGLGAFRRDHGITGFSYLFEDLLQRHPVDMDRLMDSSRRLAVSATNLLTGQVTYFERGQCDLFRAVQASATVPYVSRPVMMDGIPYLDGGCAEKIPVGWPGCREENKLVVIRTRELSYRRKPGASKLARIQYRKYPRFVESLERANQQFNDTVDQLERQAAAGEVFLIAPSKKVEVTRFEGNMEKLGDLYWLGYRDGKSRLSDLKHYLGLK